MGKKHVYLLSVLLLTIFASNAQNPFITDQFTADPTARVFEGRVYVYPSHDIPSPIDRLKEWFCMADYHVFSSDNLVDWIDHGVIVHQDSVPWINPESYAMWAPDCVYRNGKYYFYFPSTLEASEKSAFAVGVAVADKPYGPFTPQPEPIKGISGIDPCVFVDKDSQAYIYWCGQGNMYVAQLKNNMLELASAPTVLNGLPQGFKEGPFLFERTGKYYYTFPWVQDKTETLAYAIGDNPMGPFEFKGIIMDQWPSGCWTNHHSIVEFKDQWYLFYHHNDYSPQFDKNRSIRVDSLFFNSDGTIRKVTPTLRGVGITDAKRKIQLDRYTQLSEEGVDISFLNENDKFAGWKAVFSQNGSWLQYNAVDFSNYELQKVKARVYSQMGGVLEVRTGSPNGKIISEINIPSGNEWLVVESPLLLKSAGFNDLFVSSRGDYEVSIDWISFE